MGEELDTNVDTTGAADTTVADAGPKSAAEAIDQALGYAEKPVPDDKAPASQDGQPADKPVLGADGKPIDKPDAKAAKPTEKTGEKKPPDYTPPTGLSPDGMRRFQTLVADNKAVRAELAQAQQQSQQFAAVNEDMKAWQGVFDESKCQPQQFELAIDFIKAVNTGNFDRAASIITDQMRQLTLATGRDLTAPDPLQGHMDLQQELAANQITRARAIEIAASRQSQAAARQSQEQRQRSVQQEQQWNTAVQSGGAAVQAWQDKKIASDIDWPAKAPQLEKELDWLAENVHPSKWVAHLDKFYGLLQAGAPARPANTNQPLRANGGAGGAQAAPKSALEAMERGLGYQAA